MPWAVVDDPALTPHDRGVYLALCRFADRTGQCFPSLAAIREKAGSSARQVVRCLKTLEASGHIARERRRGKRGQESTHYFLVPREPEAPRGQEGPPPGSVRHTVGAREALSLGPRDTPPGSVRRTPWAREAHPLCQGDTPPVPGRPTNQNQRTSTKEPEKSKREEEEGPGSGVRPLAQEPQGPKAPELRLEGMGEGLSPAVPRTKRPPQKPGKALLDAVVELYHRTLPGLPKVRLLSSKRRKTLESLIGADSAREDPAWWQGYFGMVARAPWLLGENARGWQADFDWILAEDHMAKILEGKYAPRRGKGEPRPRDPRRAETLGEYTARVMAELFGEGGVPPPPGPGAPLRAPVTEVPGAWDAVAERPGLLPVPMGAFRAEEGVGVEGFGAVDRREGSVGVPPNAPGPKRGVVPDRSPQEDSPGGPNPLGESAPAAWPSCLEVKPRDGKRF